MLKPFLSLSLLICLLAAGFQSYAGPIALKDGKSTPRRTSQRIPETQFRRVFKEYLCRQLEKESNDVVVSKLKLSGNRHVPAGKLSLQVFQKNKRKLEGQVNLIAVVKVNGVVKNKVSLSGWVDVFGTVVCASRNLKRGEKLEKSDFYLARKNISYLSSGILSDLDRIDGLMMKHNLKADTCLKEWMLEKSPVVDRGDVVTILAESGGLKVTVLGKVLEKGYLGEFVKVQNAMSKKNIYAKVINHSTVQVNF
jgi:flagella basal body P-ring formation protein FlgA